jgi:hypothetical protein
MKTVRSRVAAAIGAATFLLLTGTGVAYGQWTTAQESVTGSATSANLDLAVAGDLTGQYSFSGAGSSNPAGSVITAIATVTNSSSSTVSLNAAFTLTATRTAGTVPGSDVQVWIYAKPAGSCVAPTSGGSTLATAVSYTAPTGTAIAPGGSAQVCVSTRLNTTTAANAGNTITIALGATAGYSTSSWVATAPAVSSVQTVFSVMKPVVTCADGSSHTVILTFPAQSGVTFNVDKSVDNGVTYTSVATNIVSGAKFGATNLGNGIVVGSGVEYLRVTAVGGTSGTAVGNPVPIGYGTIGSGTETIHCNPEGAY